MQRSSVFIAQADARLGSEFAARLQVHFRDIHVLKALPELRGALAQQKPYALIVDLELIGDYAYEMVGLVPAKQGRLPSQILSQISEIGAKIQEVLSAGIESWRNEDRGLALSARPREAAIRGECQALADKVALLTSAPGDVTAYVNLLLICRHLERITRHAVCVAEQAAEAARPAPAG